MTKRKIQYWVIPPECDAEFVANMEDVLDVYERPYNAAIPVLCMDEQPVQMVKEVKQPFPAMSTHPRRVSTNTTMEWGQAKLSRLPIASKS